MNILQKIQDANSYFLFIKENNAPYLDPVKIFGKFGNEVAGSA
jgi:hypothetical protein